MTQELLERTAREWVSGDLDRAARTARQLGGGKHIGPSTSAEEIVEALVRLAGRLHIAEQRCW